MRAILLSVIAVTLFSAGAFASTNLSENGPCSELQNRYLVAKSLHKKLNLSADVTNDVVVLERIILRMRAQTYRMSSAVYMMRENGCVLPTIRAE
jgi:hypothetical protein